MKCQKGFLWKVYHHMRQKRIILRQNKQQQKYFAGDGNDWHHIAEQSQIKKSGFSPERIHNTNNIIAVDHATHMKITGYYNTKSIRFTGGLSVTDWLAGQSYETQYNFGLDVLRKFWVIE